ncbi:type IVB secretion system apparatus protein IcmL/DotI [Legionella sp. W05-934-2]|jgi:intracellular multiplication protein IcmL|uniref:type IVB secretion system apparatus protein IcmL/DotI n=1 Tax=Legionella sp. W05-934-2 TaxID=1198649 RepID=UPI0034625647
MTEDALIAVSLRNDFYRDSQRKIMIAAILSLLLNFIIGSLLIYIYTHPPAPRYFATSINGRITPLYPLSEPNQSDAAVLQWANEAAIASYTYNFVNYREELQAASGFFTPTGWRQFLLALQGSGNLQAVKENKFVVSAVATRAPSITQKGLVNGVYSWRVQMPVSVTYQSSENYTTQNVMILMLITRVSTLNAPRGIGISQFVVSPITGNNDQDQN